MKIFGVLVFLVVLLIAGGALTIQMSGGNFLPVKVQTDNPAASTSAVESWQAEQFILLTGFILFNLIGMGVTIMVIMWILDRQVREVKSHGTAQSRARAEPAASE